MFKQYFTTRRIRKPQQLTAILTVLFVAGIGTYLLISSHAATPYASVNATSGTLANGATQQSCSGANNSSCVVFNGTASSCSPSLVDICNWPNAGNTGVPTNVKLTTYTGPTTITTANYQQPISGVEIDSCLTIEAQNVQITDSLIKCGSSTAAIYTQANPSSSSVSNQYSVYVTDSEIDGMDTSLPAGSTSTPSTHAIGGAGFESCIRCNIHGTATGINGGAFVLKDSYVWDMHEYGPGGTAGTTHNEDVLTNGTTPGENVDPSTAAGQSVVVKHNTLLNQVNQTAAVAMFDDFDPVSNVIVTDNLVSGGGYTIYGGCKTTAYTNVNTVITNNYFLRTPDPNGNAEPNGYWANGGSFGPDADVCSDSGDVWSGNVWADTGKNV